MQKNNNRVYPIKRNDDEREGQSFTEFRDLSKKKAELKTEASMSKFTLKFFGEELEAAFVSGHVASTRKSSTIAIFMLLLFEGLTGGLDVLQDISPRSLMFVLLLRYAGICPILMVLGLLSLTNAFRPYLQIGTCIASSLTGLILTAQLTVALHDTPELNVYGLHFLAHLITLLVYTFSPSKLLFPYAFGSVVLYLLGVIIVVTYYDPVGASLLCISIICIAVMLCMVNRNVEIFLRRSHAIDHIVEQEREKCQLEKQLSENLLLNIFPKVIAQKFTRNQNMFQKFEKVTIFFSDIVGFTEMSSTKEPKDVVAMLNDLFVRIDDLVRKYNVEKIKTIGDAYMCAAGLPLSNPNQATIMADLALEVLTTVEQFNFLKPPGEKPIQVRIGLHTGPCIAGVVGKHKYIYDLYGEAPNIANAMESTGIAGKVQISEATYALLHDEFICEPRSEKVDLKEMKDTQTYFLLQRRPIPAPPPDPPKSLQVIITESQEIGVKPKVSPQRSPEKPPFEKHGSRNLERPEKRGLKRSSIFEKPSFSKQKSFEKPILEKQESFESHSGDSSPEIKSPSAEKKVLVHTKSSSKMSWQVSDDLQKLRKPSLPLAELGAKVIAGAGNGVVIDSPKEFQIGMENPIYKHLQQDIQQILGTLVHLVSCKFDVKLLESEYRKMSMRRDRLQFKLGLVFIIIIAAGLDLYLNQTLMSIGSPNFTNFHLIWYLVLVLPCSIVLVTTFFPIFRFFAMVAITLVNLACGAAIIAVGFYNSYLWTGLVVAYLCNFLIVNVQFISALLTCLVLHVAINIVVFTTREAEWVGLAFFLWSAFISAALAAYFLERMARAAFLKEKLLEKEEEILRVQQSKSEELLANLLPVSIAHKLKSGQTNIASRFAIATFMFAHIVGFSKLQEEMETNEMFNTINKIFCRLDDLTTASKMEKIKSIGLTYFVAGGIPTFHPTHHKEVALLALKMQEYMEKFRQETGLSVSLRIGINVGACVAGVIGNRKWTYDLWGDDVNIASRMESSCPEGRIQLSKNARRFLKPFFSLEKRGAISVKGKGEMKTYFLNGLKNEQHPTSIVLNDPLRLSYTFEDPTVSPENVVFGGLLNSVS